MKSFALFILLVAAVAYYFWPEDTPEVEREVTPEVIDHLPRAETYTAEPWVLRSTNGQRVEIVAIHEVSPEGIRFSVKPNAPLIGSNTLSMKNTSWANIDKQSMTSYPELYKAYQRTVAGDTLKLELGPHFYDLKKLQYELCRIAPDVYIYYRDGRRTNCSIASVAERNREYRVSKWSISQKNKDQTLRSLEELTNRIEPILYRRDVILLQNKIDRARRTIQDIQTYSTTFNMSAAIAFSELADWD